MPDFWAFVRIKRYRRKPMTFRINANSCKNAMGTMLLLASVFFVCSTFVSMRSVFADPIVSANNLPQKTGRQSPRSTANNRATTARTTTSRTAASRGTTATRSGAATRNVVSRNQSTANRTTDNRAVRARTATTQSRVSAAGTVMAGSRASTSTSYSYLSSKLYTGSYSNIIDSSTGLISADAYANCMDSYYTCMDEICTARSDTKGRCSCAGRVNNFLEAEKALETANEELIKLSGQLSLLIATKGKGDDLAAAFSLTDAEKVMNCVSWKETTDKYGDSSSEAQNWCFVHHIYDATSGNGKSPCTRPDYCSEKGNSFGFSVDNINGSSSDILAQLKAWADAKDLAAQYQTDDVSALGSAYTNIASIVGQINATTSSDASDVSLDKLTNTWGYKLFEYAHNNVCGRVLDSCFNGIYEACGTPVSVTDSEGKTHNKCANGATTSCPFNYNSYISVKTDAKNGETSKNGDVVLNERGSSSASASASSSASCFGYTTTSTTTGTRSVSTTSSDPYYNLRGPVADARRSIMQKYLLDANAACDVYGANLKQTAQNINYQKIAAEQALQQKRLEFKQEEESKTLADASLAASNFDECLSELLECYETQSENTTASGARWTESRVKTYCAQISQVPHCYETMVCNPSTAQFHAVIDLADNGNCTNSTDYHKNTCRNIVTINEILNGASSTHGNIAAEKTGDSAAMREQCLLDAGVAEIRDWTRESVTLTACTLAEVRAKDPNASAGKKKPDSNSCDYITNCNTGYVVENNVCVSYNTTSDCTSEKPGALYAERTLNENRVWSACTIKSCKENYTLDSVANKCNADVIACSQAALNALNAQSGTQTWNGSEWNACLVSECVDGYTKVDGECKQNCSSTTLNNAHAESGYMLNGTCKITACKSTYSNVDNACVCPSGYEAVHVNGMPDLCWEKVSCSAGWLNEHNAVSGQTVKNPINGVVADSYCQISECETGYSSNNNTCVQNSGN